jgi:hypothetical protein
MKKLTIMALAVALFTACEKPVFDETDTAPSSPSVTTPGESSPGKKFTFTLKGDCSADWRPVTRSYLQTDGRDLTDVWILDYMDGRLVQQLHQSDNTSEDFGRPVLTLAYGSHHVYFIAARGASPVLDANAKTITFGSVRETFWKDYEVSVVATSNGNRAVTLDRVVTKLKLSFTDAIAEGTSSIEITPHTWYYGLNYETGEPVGAATDRTTSVTVPASEIGSTTTTVSLFGFSTATQWTTDVTVRSVKSDNTVLGSATIPDAPFKANRITEYSGPLFNASVSLTLSLNSTWDDSYQGTW